jgi:hypothetical protein
MNLSAGGWSKEWNTYPGAITSEPSVLSLFPGNLNVFAIDNTTTPNSLCAMTFSFDENGGATHGWVTEAPSQTGVTKSTAECSFPTADPDITSFYRDCETNFACVLQEALAYANPVRHYNFKSPPLLVPTFQGRVDAFTLLDNNTILHQSYKADSTGVWSLDQFNPLSSNNTILDNNNFASVPAVISKSRTGVDLDFYVQTQNGTLLYGHYDGKAWGNWRYLENMTSPSGVRDATSSPSIIYLDGPQTTIVFIRSGTSLYYRELTR